MLLQIVTLHLLHGMDQCGAGGLLERGQGVPLRRSSVSPSQQGVLEHLIKALGTWPPSSPPEPALHRAHLTLGKASSRHGYPSAGPGVGNGRSGASWLMV